MKHTLKLSFALFALLPSLVFGQSVKGNTPPFARNPGPTWFGRFFDFQEGPDYVTSSGNWTQAVTGTTPTATITASKSGSLVLAISSGANDKLTAIESKLNIIPGSGDSLIFNVAFTTDTKTATENIWLGITDAITNCVTTTTGYIANGIGLQSSAGSLQLWVAKGAAARANMTTVSLLTLSSSTTYKFTIAVLFDKTTSGAGRVIVWQDTSNASGTGGNQKLVDRTLSSNVPNGVSMGCSFAELATSINSPGLTIDYIGYAADR